MHSFAAYYAKATEKKKKAHALASKPAAVNNFRCCTLIAEALYALDLQMMAEYDLQGQWKCLDFDLRNLAMVDKRFHASMKASTVPYIKRGTFMRKGVSHLDNLWRWILDHDAIDNRTGRWRIEFVVGAPPHTLALVDTLEQKGIVARFPSPAALPELKMCATLLSTRRSDRAWSEICLAFQSIIYSEVNEEEVLYLKFMTIYSNFALRSACDGSFYELWPPKRRVRASEERRGVSALDLDTFVIVREDTNTDGSHPWTMSSTMF